MIFCAWVSSLVAAKIHTLTSRRSIVIPLELFPYTMEFLLNHTVVLHAHK